jgi:hypothetical protein
MEQAAAKILYVIKSRTYRGSDDISALAARLLELKTTSIEVVFKDVHVNDLDPNV